MQINKLLALASKRLSAYNAIANNEKIRPLYEAELLLAYVLGVERIFLHSNFDQVIDKKNINKYLKVINRRLNSEPIEYITQRVSFYDCEFKIKEGVLIPRADTEILLEKSFEILENNGFQNIAEIGVGSGIISILLAKAFANVKIYATDINLKAIKLTRQNIARIAPSAPHIKENITLENRAYLPKQKFDLIISNPPYIKSDYKLKNNVLKEPKEALFAGIDGLEIIDGIFEIMKSSGTRNFVCEIGFDQREDIKALVARKFSKQKYNLEFFKDLNNLDRVFHLSLS